MPRGVCKTNQLHFDAFDGAQYALLHPVRQTSDGLAVAVRQMEGSARHKSLITNVEILLWTDAAAPVHNDG
jgi:hypothetical protein